MPNKRKQLHQIEIDGRILVDADLAATTTNMNEHYLRKLAREGKTQAMKINGRWWYDRESLVSQFDEVGQLTKYARLLDL